MQGGFPSKKLCRTFRENPSRLPIDCESGASAHARIMLVPIDPLSRRHCRERSMPVASVGMVLSILGNTEAN